jgi:PAS domain S-box-containing protein
MRRFRLPLAQHLSVLWLSGSAAIAFATWFCFTLGLAPATTGFIYLAIIVLLSLADSFVSSALFSLIAVGALDYFFLPPLFSLQVASAEDMVMAGTFILTSFVITGLVRRLRQSSKTLERQAQLLDLTHDTVVTRDPRDAITFWNHGAEQLYGWTRNEALGTVSHALLKTVFPEPRARIDEKLRASDHWEGELTNTRKDSTEVIVASRWSLQRDERGQVIGILETNNDITERRRAEDALRRSQAAYLAEAQKLSLTGSFGWNVANGVVFWSEQSFAILGYATDVQPSIDLMLKRVHPDDVALVREAIERASRNPGEFDIEFRLLMPDGTIKYVHAAAHAMEDAPNKAQMVGALMDVTAAKFAEQQLHQAQAQVAHVARVTSLGALTASIAHEVNQPLAAIVSHGEASLRWLHRDVPRLDEVESSINHVIANGKRASEVVQRIRALTRRTERQISSVNLNKLVEEVVPLVRNEVARHHAFLRLDLAGDLPDIPGDPIQLQQVIINLIVNGVQAMADVDDRTRAVVVSSRVDGSNLVVLEAADSGLGVDPDHAARIFEPFFTTKSDGMGMGLSICRSIIEAHGGQIDVMPRTPGPGTIFRCVLPASLPA